MHIYAYIDAQNHSDNSNDTSSDNSDNNSIDNKKYSGIFNNIPIWVIILRDVHALFAPILFPQQRQLMGSSAQNSSAVHWCRGRVRFNEVPENVPKVPEKVGEALVQSQVRFNRVPEKVPEKVRRRFGRLCSVQSQVKFNRVPERFRSQVRFYRICGHFIHRNLAEVFPAFCFAARFRKIG